MSKAMIIAVTIRGERGEAYGETTISEDLVFQLPGSAKDILGFNVDLAGDAAIQTYLRGAE